MTKKTSINLLFITLIALSSCVSKKKLTQAQQTIEQKDKLIQEKITQLVACTEEKQKLSADLSTCQSLLDVRKNSETKNGFLTDAINIPLNDIDLHISKLNKLSTHYVHCAGGYRSMIACSILKKSGIDNLFDISGGFSEIKKVNLNINYK